METTHNSSDGAPSQPQVGQLEQRRTPGRKQGLSLSRADVLTWAQSMISQQAQSQTPTDTRAPIR